ncbi:hypothetical protein ASG73_03890 [Janibacter sp. Soil728]|uniref:hypothetical protein n=1 Tax=Janibacter sp. Soil728 TaxID=1736393 RepID=UPI0006F23C0B|nr:hypothetical protein [Janibacter sp. Soil728]KRE39468.1 hypothetical protein ASG73_03890 [Janibacter sp. Soil728]
MSGEALFWIFIIIFSVLMVIGFLLLDRPRKSPGIQTHLGVRGDPKEPRGRHLPVERADPTQTDSRL